MIIRLVFEPEATVNCNHDEMFRVYSENYLSDFDTTWGSSIVIDKFSKNPRFFLDREKIGHVVSNESYMIDKIKLILKNSNLYEKNIIKLRKNMKCLNRSTVEIRNFIKKITR